MITSRIALIGLVAARRSLSAGERPSPSRGPRISGAGPSRKSLVPRAAPVGETLQSINDDYNRLLLQMEKQRLERLGQLAASQTPRDAAETYEMLFRLAIANNLFAEAEPAAQRFLKTTSSPSPTVRLPGPYDQDHRRRRPGRL